MVEILKYLTESWVNLGIILITLFISVMFIIAAIRFVIEVVIVRAFNDCITHYFTIKGASDMAKLKLLKESRENN